MEMENQNFQFDYSTSEDEPLTLPHFDEEETIQSARPVVPLHEVRKASLVRQRWLLGVGLFLAAVLGAVAASLIYSSHGERAQDSATAANVAVPAKSPDFVAPAGEASGANLNPDEAVALENEPKKATDVEKRDVRQPPPNKSPAKTAARDKQVEKVGQQPEVKNREPQDLRSDQQWRRQQRREARYLRRQRRVQERQQGDDLTRIREIFEGSPRP